MKKLWFIIKVIFTEAAKDIGDKIQDYNRIYRLDKDICIRVLKYGDDHREGFTFEEMRRRLRLSDSQAEYVRNSIKYGEVFIIHKYTITENSRAVSKEKLLMTFEDKFRLMQYLELKAAMKSSRMALRVAIVSIIISILVGIFQIIVGLKINIS